MEATEVPTVSISEPDDNDFERDDESSPLIINAQGNENSEDTQIQTPPKDHYHLVFSVFVLVGMTTLLPWNFFISLNDFWDYKFRAVNASLSRQKNHSQTELQIEFTSYLAISSQIPNAIFVIINALIGQRFPLMRRLTVSLSVMIGSFTIICALAFADTDDWQRTFLVVLLVLVVFVNINSAIFQGGSFGMAGKFPEKYMSAQMLGQAIGGVFPALVDIVTISLDINEKDVGAVCFAIATLVLSACLISILWAMRTPFFRHFYENEDINSASSNDQAQFTKMDVLRMSWPYLVCVFLTFTVTLTLFPAVVVLVRSETYDSGSDWAMKYFTPVAVFLLFNVGDLCGRGLASWIKMPGTSTLGKGVLMIATLARFLFIPLFLNCNIVTDESRNVLFQSDGDFILFMALFAVSNGYIANICMLHGPKVSNEKEIQEAIALVLVAGLVVGTGVGSALSYPIVSALS